MTDDFMWKVESGKWKMNWSAVDPPAMSAQREECVVI